MHGANPRSYLIIGAGVFGVSTALELIKQHPTASITLLDRDAADATSRVAASWDWNKVVRADYDDAAYCALALEAQAVFRADPLWAPFYRESGIFWLCRSAYAQAVRANYARCGLPDAVRAVPVERARTMFGGVFADADYRGVTEVLVNPTSGWAAAGDCLRAVTAECVRRGVRYVVGEARTLVFDGRRCAGASLADGSQVRADTVVLATGAYTATLLELSAAASGREALQAGRRIVAGGIATGMAVLDDATFQTYKDMPVGVQGYTPASGPFIGSLPPTKDRELKWWGQTIFSNTQELLPGRFVSMPPPQPDYAQWRLSRRLRHDIDHARDVFYGAKAAAWKMDKHRICWDAFTTSGDFIVSPHPAAAGLFVATCGNFHGWKFFPVLGKYVAQMLDGALDPALAAKWAWDRDRPDAAQFPDFPRAELANLLDPLPARASL